MNSMDITHALASTLDYFRLVAMVLDRFVSKRNVALSIDHIAQDLNVQPKDIGDVCMRLASTGVIVQSPEFEHWALAVDATEVTLENVWHAIGGLSNVKGPAPIVCDTSPAYKVDLFTAQAFFGIDQTIATHLRRYHLDAIQASKRHFVYIAKMRRYEPDVDSLDAAYV